MTPNHKVLFGLGLEAGVHQVSEMLGHARFADEASLDLFSVGDHPYFAERLDAESRPIVDEAAVSVGRNPADVDTIYNVSGRLTRVPLPETRDADGRWIGGGVTQWVEELTFAVLEHRAAAFIYLLAPGESISDTALNLWAHEVVPAIREAIAKR